MADTLLFRGGSSDDINLPATTINDREIVIDTDTDEIVVGSAKKRTLMNGNEITIDSSGQVATEGTIIAGDQTAPSGSVALGVRYTSGQVPNIFGSMKSSAYSLIGFGVSSSTSSTGAFVSTADNINWKRGALQVGGELIYSNAAAQNTAVGSEVAMTSRLQINSSGNVLIGGTLPSSPNISLNASGSASFAGDITGSANTFLGGFGGTNATPGFGLYNNGGFVQSTNQTSSGINVYSLIGPVNDLSNTLISFSAAGGASFAGDITCTDNSKGLILKSPDGTSFRLSVANDGTLSASSI